ncbi:MauE/DoxX family redox-associated membrane protein [Nonomuraea turcica]|uniref:MauE/DoxX family redox-associated membrane protein n=1 Tax=Nonomuraea sp. G32 TaxID=3067274 RepID=UPI00273BAC9B|nr:MauE/DoxX family redox-associated membrane protein [Nonomuraea sp. G32]MDP4502993.1 hypothetical protein [Nonomuraea sp. G32]
MTVAVLNALCAGLALAGAMLLLYASLRRLTGGGSLTRTVAAHGILPPASARLAEPIELVVGLSMCVSWLAGWLPPFLAGAVWYAFLAGYLALVLRKKGRVPCGCLDEESPVTPAKIGRAAVIAVACVAVAGSAPPPDLGLRLVHLPVALFVAALLVLLDRVLALREAHP